MSSVLDKIKNMRQEAKKNETPLFKSKNYSNSFGVGDLEEGKTTIRIVKHPEDDVPFHPFRSTWLEVQENISHLSRYHLEKIITEKKLEKALGVKKVEELKDIEDDQLRDMISDEVGKDFQKIINKRIFISTMHGNTEIPDVIEEYIKFVQTWVRGISQDKTEIDRKLAPIRGFRDKQGKWNPGITPSTSYVCYAYNWDESTKELKRFEMWDKHMSEIEKLYASFDDDDEPLTIDPFSDAVEGIPVVFDKTKNEKNKFDFTISDKKNNNRRMTPVDFAKQFSLSKEMLEEIAEQKSLKEIYSNVYGKRDFELALNGLQYFDEKNSIGAFENDEFLEIIEKIAAYYENEEVPEKEEKKNKPTPKQEVKKEQPTQVKKSSETKKMEPPKQTKKEEPKEEPEGESPYGDTIEELEQYIEDNKLPVVIKRKDSFDDIVKKIDEVLNGPAEDNSTEEKNHEVEEPENDSDDQNGSFTEAAEASKPSMSIEELRKRLSSKKK